ncbi:MAG: T9SS type A sorting domain-containing protein [Flavobacteriaceae bacterium]|nr:T9SS type A sorting domain-containing protein [Flavobacteriaceae bacterium]
MKKILTFFICSMFYLGFSQNITITYENPLGIEIFGSEEIYHVFIQNNTENIIDENSILEVNLPVGITYVDNSVSSNFMVTSVLDVNNPEFTTINPIAVGEIITLEFKAEAKCNSYAFIDDNLVAIKNGINYSYSIGGVNQSEIILNETDSYNLSFSDVSLELPLEILSQANQTLEFNSINESLTQSLHINIPGNSAEFSTFQINVTPTSELEFMGISELIIGTTSYSALVTTIIAPLAPSTTTNLIFKASDIDTILSNFSANMLIKVKLDYKAKNCFIGNSQHVEYESVIGSLDDGNCVVAKSIGDFEFLPLAPSLSYSFDSDDGLNLCGETSSVEYTITNSIDASGAAYDIHLLLNSNYGCEISNIKINGIPVETSIYTSGNDSMVHLFGDQIFDLTDLTDEDNDGEIDDLAPGATIRVTCDVSLALLPEDFLLDNCNSGFYGLYFQSEFYSLNSECETSYSTDNGLYSSFQLNDTGKSTSLLLDIDVNDGESNHIQFCFERNGGGNENQIYDDTMLLEANIEIPCGAELNLNITPTFTTQYGTELTTIATTSIVNEKTILHLEVMDPYVFSNSMSTYGGCFEFDLLLNCDNFINCTNTDPLLEATVYGAFSECTSQKMNLGCEQKKLYLHCIPVMPSCPSPYAIIASDFEAVRTSYGTSTNGTQITIEGVDDGNFSGLNTKGAYAGDSIRTEITGTAMCEIGSDQTIYGYIWYSHPENFPFLTMTGAEYINDDGDSVTVNNFNIRTDLSTAIKTVYQIQVNNQEINAGNVIKIRGMFIVDKIINNSSGFPNVYTFGQFRGGFNLNPTPPPTPLHYGADFEVYGLDYFGGFVGTPAICSAGGDFNVSFHVQGGFEDDFPNEFRNVIQIIGPLEVIIPAAINGGVVLASAKYSVSGVSGLPNLSIHSVVGNPGVFRIYDTGYGSLEEFRPFDKTSTIMYCSIRIRLELNDCTLPAGQTIDVVGSHLEQGYAEEPSKEIIETNYLTNIASNGSGFVFEDLSIDVVNPFFQTIGSVTRYKIDVDNINTQQAKHPWIKFTYPDNLITINNSAIDGYDIVGSVYDTNTLLLKLQPINAGCGMEGYIDVTLNDCDFNDQYVDIQIETGISCEPISDDVFNNDGVVCPLDTDKKVQLEIIKSNLRMDVIPLFDSSVPLQYCDSFQYIVQIFNNEKANITSPSFQVDVPNGFEMSVQYLYPVFEAIDATNSQFNNTGFSLPIDIISGQLWDLEETNGILPGYIANQSDYLNNYYQLLVTLTPTCGYDGVSSINFSASGITNCNEDKEITFQSTPTFLELDALNNYSHQLYMDVQQNAGLDNYTAIVHYVPNTDISDSLGVFTVNLPAGIYSTDNLNFTLPSSGGTDFIFDFTMDPEYCGDVSFLINTIIDIELGCNTNTTCVSRFELQDTLTEYICIQECVIERVDIEVITGFSCLNYNLNAVTSVVSYGDLVSYDWVITDTNNNLIGNYSGNEIEVDLPNVGMPFTAVLTVLGMNNNGSVCKAKKIVTLTPSCEQCDINGEFTISTNSNDACNSIVLTPNITVYNGEITSYLWSLYDEQGNVLETIHSNTIIPELFIYEFLENGVYRVCLEINSSNILGETCSKQICKEVIINCTPCSVDSKFSTQKISDCTYQFNNHSIVSNWSDVEYLWDFGDGNTSTEFEPRHTYTTTGSNNVFLTVTTLNSTNGSCESTFGPMKIEVNSCFQDGGCLDITDTTDIDVFPNPNNGVFTLSFNSCIKSSEIRVYDTLGKIIYYKIMRNDNKVFIDISNCAKGVYFVKVSSNTMSKTKRIIIE